MISITELVNWLETNPWISLILFVLGILGITITLYVFFIGPKEKEPMYALFGYNIISEDDEIPEKFKVLYQDNEIENFTVSTFVFWNRGREPIMRKDVAPKAPLTIKTSEDTQILEYKLVKEIESSNNFIFDLINNKELVISFDFVDAYEGVMLEIFHTGQSSDDLDVSGKFIGAKGFLKKDTQTISEYFPITWEERRGVSIGALIFAMFLLILVIFSGEVVLRIAAFIIIIINIWYAIRLSKRILPKAFEEFE